MRAKRVIGACAVSAALLVAGCSSSGAKQSTPTSVASTTTATAPVPVSATTPTTARPTCPGPPNTLAGRFGQDLAVVSVPCDCPLQPVTPAPPGAKPGKSAAKAAEAWVEHAGWVPADTHVEAVYKVGDRSKGQFGAVFARNVPMYCGAAVAAASYGVELGNPTIDNTGRQHSVVVAHFAHGWEVWGEYV